jgi:hypothetical protein
MVKDDLNKNVIQLLLEDIESGYVQAVNQSPGTNQIRIITHQGGNFVFTLDPFAQDVLKVFLNSVHQITTNHALVMELLFQDCVIFRSTVVHEPTNKYWVGIKKISYKNFQIYNYEKPENTNYTSEIIYEYLKSNLVISYADIDSKMRQIIHVTDESSKEILKIFFEANKISQSTNSVNQFLIDFKFPMSRKIRKH